MKIDIELPAELAARLSSIEAKLDALARTEDDGLWDSARAAEYLGVKPATIGRWAREGRLPTASYAGNRRRFKPDDVKGLG